MSTRQSTEDELREALRFEDERYAFSERGPRAKAAGDGDRLAGIVETLYSEHAYIGALLDRLELEAARLEPGRVPDYPLLLEMIDYLTHYPDQYHHPREDRLFASLLRGDAAFGDRLERLTREHRVLHRYNDELFGELSDINKGRPVDRPELRRELARYVGGYRQHMDYESREIFPLARGTLSPEELAELDAATRSLDDPLFGGRVHRRFRRLGRTLRSTLEGLPSDLIAGEIRAVESLTRRLAELGEQLHGSVAASLEEHVHRLRGLLGLAPRPSWQARIMNACTRVTIKPLMRFGSVESLRSMTRRLEEQQAGRLPADIVSHPVGGRDYAGEWIRIGRARRRKIVLYLPGGAFILRATVQHKAFVARICRAAECEALLIHYRLAPEVPFPGGLEDCIAAYHDLLREGHRPEDITLAGDSAGGGLVLSTLLALRDEGTPMPANAIVLSPLADLTYSGESRKTNRFRDPLLPTHRASEMHALYIGEVPPQDRFVSPVFADFDGLPPILGLVGSTEILLDDTVRAAAQADRAGVSFFLEVWNEMPHVFPIFAILPESRVAVERMAEFIHRSRLPPLPARYGKAA